MQEEKRSGKRQVILPLLLIYAACVGLRYLLAVLSSNFPTVYIDEFLYYGMGRSIASTGTLLYSGQPATYNFIAYPLVLSPVYALFGHGTNYYRVIQLWNILLMNLSVFPVYGLCNAMLQKRKQALWLTVLIMLLPNFLLAQFIYSEAIIYPMFFTLMYCIYRNLGEVKLKYAILTGVLGASMYSAKPGAILPAALALFLFAGKAVRAKNKKSWIALLAGVLSFAAVFLAFKLVAEQVFGYRGTLLSIYDDQAIRYPDLNHDFFFSTLIQYPYYFLLAFGILPFMVSMRNYHSCDKRDKQFYLFLVLCVVLTIIGIVWTINRPERRTLLYLRYFEMYLPLIFIYCLKQGTEQPKAGRAIGKARKATEIIAWVLLAYVTVATVVWGSTTGIGQIHDSHFLISVAFLYIKNIAGFANILIIFMAAVSLFLMARKMEKRTLSRICLGLYITTALLSNLGGYLNAADNTNSVLAQETEEIHRIIGDTQYLTVCTERCDFGLDIRSRKNIDRVTFDDFANNLIENQGVYTPFVPTPARGMDAVNKTQDVDTVIIDEGIYPFIQVSKEAESFISAQKSFKVVRFSKGARIADCIMNVRNGSEDGSATCVLEIFNEELLNKPLRISIDIDSPVEQEMELDFGDTMMIPLNQGRYTYELNSEGPVRKFAFTVRQSNIQVHGFEVAIRENNE